MKEMAKMKMEMVMEMDNHMEMEVETAGSSPIYKNRASTCECAMKCK